MHDETRILFSFPRGLKARSASEGQSRLPSLALRAFKATAPLPLGRGEPKLLEKSAQSHTPQDFP
ncbi:MAG: hypothetical protein L0312_05535, partial [Acidobacteria bacterium]|nr:hypothetical protein [Acidobacteriota bacterium]